MLLYSHSKEHDRLQTRKDRDMKEYKRVKNVSLIWTEEFDIIKEWDDNGHIIKQEIANYRRYRTIS